MKVVFEWLVEASDDAGDIFDVSHFDTLAEAKTFAAQFEPGEAATLEICLRRDVLDDKGNAKDRQYAYPGADAFEGGAPIPVHLIDDFKTLGDAA